MSDFNVQITVRNARLLRAVREKYGSAAELARVIGKSQQQVSALMTMRETPLKKDGGWRDVALDIAGALECDPADLWPGRMKERTLKRATAEMELSEEQVAQMLAPADDPILAAEQNDMIAKLAAGLTERQRYVVHQRMTGARLEDLAKEIGVNRERVRQIENKALRNMRIKAARMGIKSFYEANSS